MFGHLKRFLKNMSQNDTHVSFFPPGANFIKLKLHCYISTKVIPMNGHDPQSFIIRDIQKV